MTVAPGLLSFATALAVGLLVGAERERSHGVGSVPGGIRTYALVALVGAVAASLSGWAVAAGLLVVGALVVVGYLRTSRDDSGQTTEAATLVVYVLGALAWSRPALAAGLAVVVTVLASSKDRLHRFVRDVVSDTELEDALKFLVAALVVLPLLPSGAIGPYDVLDARRIWTIVVVLTGVNAVGYVATRALGAGRGLAVTGIAGGFVSASATTGAMAVRARDPRVRTAALAAALLASVSTLIQLAGVVAVVAPPLLLPLLPTVVAGVAVLLLTALALTRKGRNPTPTDARIAHDADDADDADATADTTDDSAPGPSSARLFALVPALILAGLLTAATLAARWGVDVLGASGIVLASGLAGLADAHAGALATATLFTEGLITTASACIAIGAALLTNTVVKAVLATIGGGGAVGRRYVVLMLPTVATVALGLLLAVRLA